MGNIKSFLSGNRVFSYILFQFFIGLTLYVIDILDEIIQTREFCMNGFEDL